MRFFVDTANIDEIKKANDMSIICGVTTNPSLLAKEGRDFKQIIGEIASLQTDQRNIKFQEDYRKAFGK